MRVATRRMRAALRVFGAYLDADVMRPVDRGLRRTGRVLGAVRDLDVFHEKTMVYLDSLPEDRRGDLDPLLAVWQVRREHARAEMIEYFDGGRYPRFVEAFTTLLDDPGRASLGFIDDDGEARPHRVAHVLPAVLYDRVAGVWAYDDVITGHDTPLVRFHRLRIAGKALRYTFEFFEEVLGADAKPLISATKGMQDHLGDLQDAVVTCNILRNFLAWGAWDPPAGNARRALAMIVAPGVATYLAARQEELNRLVDTFPEMWTHDPRRRLQPASGEGRGRAVASAGGRRRGPAVGGRGGDRLDRERQATTHGLLHRAPAGSRDPRARAVRGRSSRGGASAPAGRRRAARRGARRRRGCGRAARPGAAGWPACCTALAVGPFEARVDGIARAGRRPCGETATVAAMTAISRWSNPSMSVLAIR